jgi:hypothetical protein
MSGQVTINLRSVGVVWILRSSGLPVITKRPDIVFRRRRRRRQAEVG